MGEGKQKQQNGEQMFPKEGINMESEQSDFPLTL